MSRGELSDRVNVVDNKRTVEVFVKDASSERASTGCPDKYIVVSAIPNGSEYSSTCRPAKRHSDIPLSEVRREPLATNADVVRFIRRQPEYLHHSLTTHTGRCSGFTV